MNKERPILFNTEMVQALDAGIKTQTRRTSGLEVVNGRPDDVTFSGLFSGSERTLAGFRSKNDPLIICSAINTPYEVGDLLWVRETWSESGFKGNYVYKAEGGDPLTDSEKWRPSIHMPKEAARIWLKVVDVRVERLLNITEKDAVSEGIAETERWPEAIERPIYKMYGKVFDKGPGAATCFDPILSFMTLWTSINGDDSALKNPWVWVVEFEKVENPSLSTKGMSTNLLCS